MRADHHLALAIDHQLHQRALGTAGHGVLHRAEGLAIDLDLAILLARALLAQPDAADLRITIRAARHMIVIDRANVLSGDPLGRDRVPTVEYPVVNLTVRDEADRQSVFFERVEEIDGRGFPIEVVGNPVGVDEITQRSTAGRVETSRCR